MASTPPSTEKKMTFEGEKKKMLYLSAGADMARGQRAALHRKSERGIVVPVPVFGFRV